MRVCVCTYRPINCVHLCWCVWEQSFAHGVVCASQQKIMRGYYCKKKVENPLSLQFTLPRCATDSIKQPNHHCYDGFNPWITSLICGSLSSLTFILFRESTSTMFLSRAASNPIHINRHVESLQLPRCSQKPLLVTAAAAPLRGGVGGSIPRPKRSMKVLERERKFLFTRSPQPGSFSHPGSYGSGKGETWKILLPVTLNCFKKISKGETPALPKNGPKLLWCQCGCACQTERQWQRVSMVHTAGNSS